MRVTQFLALPGLLLLAANTLAAVNTTATGSQVPTAERPPETGAPDEIAYKVFLNVLASVAEQDHHSYLHLLGEALRINVHTADQAAMQTIDAYGVALLDQNAALETEELAIRRHRLCAQGVRSLPMREFLHGMDKIDSEVQGTRNLHLQASLSAMPTPARTYFQRFLHSFAQGVRYTKLDVHAQFQAAGSIEAYIADLCAPDNNPYRVRLHNGGVQ